LSQKKREYAAWDVSYLLETYRFLRQEIEKVTKQAYDRLCMDHSQAYVIQDFPDINFNNSLIPQNGFESEKIFVFSKQHETIYLSPKDSASLSNYEPIVLKCSSEEELQLLLSKIPDSIVKRITQESSDFVEFTLDAGKPIQVLFADDTKLILK